MNQKYSPIMTKKCTLAIDHSQEDATLKVLPNSHLLHSFKTQLSGIYLEYHYAPSHETPLHYPTQHVIAIQTKGKVNAERKLGQSFRQEQIKPGDVCIVPAYTRHWIHTQSEQELILLSIDPAFLNDIASGDVRYKPNSITSSDVELIPHFAQDDPLIYYLGLSLIKALQTEPFESRIYAESLCTTLAAHLLQYYAVANPLQNCHNLDRTTIGQATEYINAYLTQDLSLETIAAEVGMSKYQFCRVFKQVMGITPWQYVVKQRIKAAKQLLKNHHLSIAQISRQLGFSTQGQFSNFFYKHVGVRPTRYRTKI